MLHSYEVYQARFQTSVLSAPRALTVWLRYVKIAPVAQAYIHLAVISSESSNLVCCPRHSSVRRVWCTDRHLHSSRVQMSVCMVAVCNCLSGLQACASTPCLACCTHGQTRMFAHSSCCDKGGDVLVLQVLIKATAAMS